MRIQAQLGSPVITSGPWSSAGGLASGGSQRIAMAAPWPSSTPTASTCSRPWSALAMRGFSGATPTNAHGRRGEAMKRRWLCCFGAPGLYLENLRLRREIRRQQIRLEHSEDRISAYRQRWIEKKHELAALEHMIEMRQIPRAHWDSSEQSLPEVEP